MNCGGTEPGIIRESSLITERRKIGTIAESSKSFFFSSWFSAAKSCFVMLDAGQPVAVVAIRGKWTLLVQFACIHTIRYGFSLVRMATTLLSIIVFTLVRSSSRYPDEANSQVHHRSAVPTRLIDSKGGERKR